MSAVGAVEESFRELIRGVVREEIRAALDERSRRNATESASEPGGYLSLARAAKRADVAAGTMRRWIREGRLMARRAGRVYRIGHDELERFLASDAGRASLVSEARAFLAGAG